MTAFIRRKMVRGVAYYSIVENRRVEGKVRQKVLYSLCRQPTIEDAIAMELRHLEWLRAWADQARLAQSKARLKELGRWAVVLEKATRGRISGTTGEQIEIFNDENA